jgi:hypothetical protein
MKGKLLMIAGFIVAALGGLGWLLFRPSEFRSIKLPRRSYTN